MCDVLWWLLLVSVFSLLANIMYRLYKLEYLLAGWLWTCLRCTACTVFCWAEFPESCSIIWWFSTFNLYLLCVQKRYRNFRRHPYSHYFLQIWHLYLRSKLLLLAYCCQLQVCCYWAIVPQCRVVPSGTTTVKSDVESTATGVLCHDVVQYYLIPPPVEFVVKSTTTCILCHDVVQSGTTTGRVCCQVYCYREYRRTVSWCTL